jgi:TonB-linked SusC/RagA family outer membrane protein
MKLNVLCKVPLRAGLLSSKTLLIMKLTIVLLIAACMQVSAKGYAQKITLSQKNVSLAKVFREIRNQSGYLFLYNDRQLKKLKKVNINVKDASIEQVLEESFKGQPLTYTIVDKTIVVIPKEELNVFIPAPPPPPHIITGTVRDEKGEPLAGVSISVKGTSIGTTTNEKGFFRLELIRDNAVLSISYVGYLGQEIVVGNRTIIDIKLQASTKGLDDIVVVGYGTVKKSDLTGSVVSVKGDEMNRSTISSFDQGLSGRASGVQVTQQSGQPGGATSVRIRGTNSINTASEPLYVIDGFPYYNDNNATSTGVLSSSPSQNVLATINPADIESIEILKDASATAIYGSRGANGVVLITTKRGKAGKTKIEYNASFGIQKVLRYIPLLNARQYAEFRNENYSNNIYTQSYLDKLGAGTDWQKAITRTALMNTHNLSLTGGNDKIKYAITGGYLGQDGIVEPTLMCRLLID